MDFAEGHIYHVFNRGNNSQTVFFDHGNYLFFLDKIRKYILPHADILAWCLMPNHVHLMISVKQIEVTLSEQVTPSHLLTKARSLNDSISILLRSYTRAIQKQERMTGSLFQNRTKVLCLTEPVICTSLFPNPFRHDGKHRSSGIQLPECLFRLHSSKSCKCRAR